jgi:hypothetical protein
MGISNIAINTFSSSGSQSLTRANESDKTKSWDQRGYRRFWVAKKETS